MASVKPDDPHPRLGIIRIQVGGFRTAHDVSFSPGKLCALVGEADAGKSNLLAAIRAVLDPAAAPVTVADTAEGGDGNISIRIELANGGEASLEWTLGHDARVDRDGAPPRLLFLPAAARAAHVLVADATAPDSDPGGAPEVFRRALHRSQPTSAGRALSLVDALEQCCARRLTGRTRA